MSITNFMIKEIYLLKINFVLFLYAWLEYDLEYQGVFIWHFFMFLNLFSSTDYSKLEMH